MTIVEQSDRTSAPGYHFSRVQMRIALTRLLERLPGIRLDPERPPVFDGWESPRAAAPPRALRRMTWVDAGEARLADEPVRTYATRVVGDRVEIEMP